MKYIIFLLLSIYSFSAFALDEVAEFKKSLIGKWSLVRGLPCDVAEYTYNEDGTFQVLFNGSMQIRVRKS